MIETAQLIIIEEFIDRARNAGYKFGKGDPKNRLRYLTKTGILPHAIRLQIKETDAHTSGYYPEAALQLLLSAQKLKKQEKLSAQKIADRVEPIVTAVERGALQESLVTTTDQERLRYTAEGEIREIGGGWGSWLAPVVAGTTVFLVVLSQTVFGRELGRKLAGGVRSALFPEEAIRQMVGEAEGTRDEGQGLRAKGDTGMGTVLGDEELSSLSLWPLAFSPNLLKNPSFEAAGSTAPAAFLQFHPNSTDGNTQRSNHTAHSGSWSLLLSCQENNDCFRGVIQEATKTESGRNYTLGAWVKIQNSDFRIQISELHLA